MATTDKPVAEKSAAPKQPVTGVSLGNIDSRSDAPKAAAPAEQLIEARCLKFFGKHDPGDIVKVTPRVYRMSGPTGTRSLITATDEAKEREATTAKATAAKSQPPADAVEKKAEKGWAALGRQSRELTLARRAQDARAQAEMLEAARATAAARG